MALFQDLTDAEQSCVSRKISKLRDEGVEEDEAIARAIKECAPSKARPTQRSGHKDVDQGADIPRYRADRAVDGTFTIFDVPVFAAHKETRSDDREVDFGTPWLNGALATAQRRQAEGYMAPLHVRHHGDALVEAAGKFRLTRVGKIMHDGQEVDALFADLVGVRPEIFQRIMKGELSYRSVEILDVSRTEIDSLALLDDEVPFFRFPLLRVAVDHQPPALGGGDARVTLALAAASGPARYYTASGAGVGTAALFRFEARAFGAKLGKRLRNLREDKGISTQEMAERMSKILKGGDIKASTINQIETGVSVDSLERDIPKGKEPGEGRFSMTIPNTHTGAAPATDPTNKNATAEQLLMQIFSMLQQAMGPQAQQQPPGPPNGPPNGPPMQQAQHPQGPGPVEQHPPFPVQRATPVGGVMSQFAATGSAPDPDSTAGSPDTALEAGSTLAAEGAVDGLAARMAAMEAKFTAAENQNAVERRATELATHGFSAEQVQKFRGVAAEHGLDGANVYAQALEDHGPSVPPSHWSGEIRGEAPDAPEVSKYAAQGPEVLAAARDLHASWRRTGSDVPFEQYFESNHNADAFLGVRR